MESPTVNDLLPDEITKITYSLLPPGFQGEPQERRRMQEDIGRLVDSIGEQSTKAQGLSRVITSADKMRKDLGHSLYVLKDAQGNNGKGEVIGILKVGKKHLYLFDDCSHVRQLEPLCVLDFFVVGERQRQGLGRKLFDYMLKDTRVKPDEMAVDGPSAKLEQFLRKNYGFERLIKQSNNFAVSPKFFTAIATSANPGRSTSIVGHAPCVGRFAAHQPRSDIANVIHGGGGHNGAGASHGAELAGSPERPASLPLQPQPSAGAPPSAAAPPSAGAPLPAGAPPSAGASPQQRRDPQVTNKGFFDVKFYHNRLW